MDIKVKHMNVFENRDDHLLGICDLTLGGEWAVRGVRIVQGQNGPFVSLPSHQNGKGEYQDIAYPTTKEGRDELNKAVLGRYQREIAAEHTDDRAAAR